MPTVIITGGTGLIGNRLTQMLIAKGYEVILFSHSNTRKKIGESIGIKKWDINTGEFDKESITKADCVIHLAGANVAEKRWTHKRKQEIIDSRTKSSALLIRALQEVPNHIKTVVSASAVGWYGEDNAKSLQEGFCENDPASNDFLGTTTRLWEESIKPVEELNKRLVILRTGIILSKDGGALREFIKPLRFGIATVLGKGSQVISWLHIDDVCRLYIQAIERDEMSGPYNAVAPAPVTNRVLVKTLAHVMRGKRYLIVTVPSFALKLLLGELSVEVLKGATVSSQKTEKSGFAFLYNDVKSALTDLMKK